MTASNVTNWFLHPMDWIAKRQFHCCWPCMAWGGPSRPILKSTGGRFNELADHAGCVVAYPNAVRRIWDLEEGKISGGLRQRTNDFTYLETVITQISSTHRIITSQIIVAGMSRGGRASFYLACKRPDLVRAIAAVAMSLPAFLLDECQRIRRTGIVMINGTDDAIVPYVGGPIEIGNRMRDHVLGTNKTLRVFAKQNGRSGTATKRIGQVEQVDWQDCNAPTVLYRVKGGVHSWPGDRTARKAWPGSANHDVNAADEIWAFFSPF